MDPGGSRVMETELRASQVQTPASHNHHNHHHHHRAVAHQSFREESGDEELSVLPRHTKVIVTGNNRTKSVLVGLQGVVKSVGLGGWHFLVSCNFFSGSIIGVLFLWLEFHATELIHVNYLVSVSQFSLLNFVCD
jgi:hypothetical protein